MNTSSNFDRLKNAFHFKLQVSMRYFTRASVLMIQRTTTFYLFQMCSDFSDYVAIHEKKKKSNQFLYVHSVESPFKLLYVYKNAIHFEVCK